MPTGQEGKTFFGSNYGQKPLPHTTSDSWWSQKKSDRWNPAESPQL